MKVSKLKNESGSAMLLVIFLMALVSIMMISFSTQVGNQIKSTMKADESIQKKYDAESKIEEGIAKFIEGINVIYKDDIYKDTNKINSSNQKIYKQYIYYDIQYTKNIYYENVNIINDIEFINDDGMISIFNKNIDTYSAINPIPADKEEPKFDSNNLNKGTTFTLEFIEDDTNKKSIIDVNIKNISGDKGNEKCTIDYEVKSWRS